MPDEVQLFEQQTKRLLAEYKAKYFTAQKQIAREEDAYKVNIVWLHRHAVDGIIVRRLWMK